MRDEGKGRERGRRGEGEVWSVQGSRVWRGCREGEVEDLVRK